VPSERKTASTGSVKIEHAAAVQRTPIKVRELKKAEREADSFFTCGAGSGKMAFTRSASTMSREFRSRFYYFIHFAQEKVWWRLPIADCDFFSAALAEAVVWGEAAVLA
jgi:hypothetical protein